MLVCALGGVVRNRASTASFLEAVRPRSVGGLCPCFPWARWASSPLPSTFTAVIGSGGARSPPGAVVGAVVGPTMGPTTGFVSPS